NSSIILGDTRDGKVIKRFLGPDEADYALALSPNGRHALTGSPLRGHLHLWDVQTGKIVCRFEGGHDGGVLRVAFSPNGQRVYSYGMDHALRLWDVGSGKQLCASEGIEGYLACFSADRRRAITIVQRFERKKDGRVVNLPDILILYDVESGKAVQRCESGLECADAVVITSDGNAHLRGTQSQGF